MPHSWHSPSPTPWVHDTLWASKLKGMQTMINYKTKISILRRSMAHQRLKTGLGPRSGELLVQGVHREPAGWLQMRRSSPAHPQSKHQPDLPPDSHFIHTATWGQSSVVDIRLAYINIRISWDFIPSWFFLFHNLFPCASPAQPPVATSPSLQIITVIQLVSPSQ
jgi:hypothetical protein